MAANILRSERAVHMSIYVIHALDHDRELRRALMERAIGLMATGRLRPPPPTLLPLTEAARAHEMMEAGRTMGKVVLAP